ncbi:MAG: hypothetical protein LDL41_03090 [Coleofasciculus sp. S288]|nr:hypothetical protein [Coleofasciculus sp. S288]
MRFELAIHCSIRSNIRNILKNYQDYWLPPILKLAQTINPQINPDQKFTITREELEELRQLPDGTLGHEVADFLDNNDFEPLNSGDWIQRTHDVWHVLTGFSSSPHDEMLLQIFTRAQVFRPTSAIVVLVGLLSGMCNCKEVRQVLKMGKQAKSLINWDIKSDWKTPLAEVRQKLNVMPLDG